MDNEETERQGSNVGETTSAVIQQGQRAVGTQGTPPVPPQASPEQPSIPPQVATQPVAPRQGTVPGQTLQTPAPGMPGAQQVADPGLSSYNPRRKFAVYQAIDFVFWVGSAFLVIRFVLMLLAANPDNAFVRFIYTISYRPVGIFADVLGENTLITLTTGGKPDNVIELSTLVAWLVLWLLYMIARKLVAVITSSKA